jgi:TolA-binding protein
MRSALLIAMLCALSAVAAAQPDSDRLPGELQQPDGALLVQAPQELRTYDEPTARRRVAELDRAITAARDPLARAALQLERATLRAAQAQHERLAWLTAQIRRDEEREPAARQALDPEIAQRRATAERATAAAIAEFTELVCDPADRARGFGCRPPAALRAWPRLDEALFQLAYLLSAERRTDDAARAYRRIVDDYPGSRYRGDALVAVADRAFEQADLAAAEPLYRAAQTARGPVTPTLRAYAAYKLGWVHLNLGRIEPAIASFAAVPGLAGNDPKSATLVREARRDLSRALALRRPASASSP